MAADKVKKSIYKAKAKNSISPLLISFFLFISIFALSSCVDQVAELREKLREKKPLSDGSPVTDDYLFEKAMAEYEDEDWLDAYGLFELLFRNFSGQYDDEALLYMAKIHYKKGEYRSAIYHYNSLIRKYSASSPYISESMFNIGLCYYELSPPYDRDQKETREAIQAFSNFQSFFPQDSLYSQAEEYIQELRDKLAHGDYFIASLYKKNYSLRSALIYYNSVLDKYRDTKYYEPAYYDKIEILIDMRRFDEAKGHIRLYKQNFSDKKYQSKIRDLEENFKNAQESVQK